MKSQYSMATMISNTLSRQVVLVTRPLEQQQSLVDAIEQRSAAVLSLPLLKIRPIEQRGDIQAMKSNIQQLDNYQLLIFISSNAARHGADWIDSYWPQFPQGIKLMAIGPTTKTLLEEMHFGEVYQGETGMSSEDLLCLDSLRNVDGMKIAIFRGKGGRELLGDTLRSRGAEVDYLEVYERQPINYDEVAFHQSLKDHRVTILTITSGESLNLLSRLLLSGDNKQEFSLLPLLVPSQRVAQMATEAGFENVIACDGADTDSFIKVLESL